MITCGELYRRERVRRERVPQQIDRCKVLEWPRIHNATNLKQDMVTGKKLQLENSAHDNSNPPKGTNMLRLRHVQKIGFVSKLGVCGWT